MVADIQDKKKNNELEDTKINAMRNVQCFKIFQLCTTLCSSPYKFM